MYKLSIFLSISQLSQQLSLREASYNIWGGLDQKREVCHMVNTCCKTENSSQQHLTALTDTVGGGSLVRPLKREVRDQIY